MEETEATGSWCVMEPSSFAFWDIVGGSPSVITTTKKNSHSPFCVEGSLEDSFQNIIFLCEISPAPKLAGQ